MSEQTNPQGGVAQEPLSDEDRVNRILEQPKGQAEETETPPPEQSAEVQPEGQAPAEEVTPDDIPDEQPVAQPAVDAFEIVHNGQTHKLTREDTIKYAMQGFDYTQKTQAVAAKDRYVTEQLQRLSQVDQVAPQLQGQLAQVKAIEAQLAPYQSVNWVQEAANDPGRYAQLRAQYDVLRDAYGQAASQYTQAEQSARAQLRHIAQQRLQAEAQRLPELVPEWKDPQRMEADKAAISKHYTTTYGINEQELNAEANTAFKVAVLQKAMKYDQLVRSKADKSKTLRTAPPVTRPGAAQTPDAAKADQRKALTQNLRKSGDLKDAAALILNLGLVK